MYDMLRTEAGLSQADRKAIARFAAHLPRAWLHMPVTPDDAAGVAWLGMGTKVWRIERHGERMVLLREHSAAAPVAVREPLDLLVHLERACA
ncbi:hypothetical protein [Roseomonas chloroacetimidivorans]|uniref:hypothetical protein n=1 Tax=Roseomonas chloroacetimidivorans TaxID=1766656 RepID=UPI003C78C0BA